MGGGGGGQCQTEQGNMNALVLHCKVAPSPQGHKHTDSPNTSANSVRSTPSSCTENKPFEKNACKPTSARLIAPEKIHGPEQCAVCVMGVKG